ncbi:phosphoribosylamine--glycine ligase [Pseudanabaena sp. FACHB-1277]|uniref:Phosphoribosylamine--glycine ligase n=1 Tax=Pseudanabaena cinerea FACHB-1277 TaxID=2949581 RepID=A0A926US67_9CYAN|nr:phosphoribosylamine--glycine ligase [Pseudanabaena cinerea]MBD2150251.1 phosphoribosylamine--glycine ligase [Pseudanabaena cinerea FACHB-1277]
MKVLVVGSGGREHALAWKLLQSPNIDRVFCIPGNGGTATMPNCQNVSLSIDDFEGMLRFAQVQGVGFTMVGPELPLALGIVDYFQAAESLIFGPTQEGAMIESSKAWAKTLMAEAQIPTAASATFNDLESAQAYVQQQGAPIVIKADGLASGKGVTVAMDIAEAIAALERIFAGQFGSAGETVVIEEFMTGQEVSVLAFTDGQTIRPLCPAQDHKRLGDGDTGPNTGGMGAYAPAPIATRELMAKVQTRVLEPAIAALRARGIDYRGCLYAGLMITPEGEPKVVEFNCRLGDPETQAILPLLDTNLDELILACIEGKLANFPPLKWKNQAAVCIVMAAGGYPDKVDMGQFITGIGKAEDIGAFVFQSGTRLKNNALVTNGGRVLGVTALGDNIRQAITNVYSAVDFIAYDGMYYRKDIASKAVV